MDSKLENQFYHVIALFGPVLPLRSVSLPEPERIEVPVAPAFGPYRRFFPREAVRQPAKANLQLIKRLVEFASSPGHLILEIAVDLTERGRICCEPLSGVRTTKSISPDAGLSRPL
jgi:hypothetical protein